MKRSYCMLAPCGGGAVGDCGRVDCADRFRRRDRAELRRSLQGETFRGRGTRRSQQAGGTLVYSYGADRRRDRELGERVVPRRTCSRTTTVESASATAGFATQLERHGQAGGPPAATCRMPRRPTRLALGRCSGTWGRSTRREAHAITGGSPAVLVGDIDTGHRLHASRPGGERRRREQRQLPERRARPGLAAAGRQRPRHAHGRDDRRGIERDRDRRRRAERQDRRRSRPATPTGSSSRRR